MNQQPPKILIIDDDERNIFAMTAVLKAKKISCLSAVSGLDGLRLLKETPDVDAALVDMMMPDMDGYELIEKVRNEPGMKHISLIAVTAQAMAGDKEKCLAAGADGYISKPVDIDKLMRLMNELFSGKGTNT